MPSRCVAVLFGCSLLLALGAGLGMVFAPAAAQPGSRYFAQTGYTVGAASANTGTRTAG